MRMTRLFVLIVTVIVLVSASVFAQDLQVKQTVIPVVVDGLANDGVWAAVEENLVANPYVGEPDDAYDSQGLFKMTWDDTYLYFICEVWDEVLWEDSEGVNEHDESFDLFIDPWLDGGDVPQEDDALLTLEWSSTGTTMISGAKGGFTELDTVGIISKCSETDLGYIIEAAIPLDNLMLSGGESFGFDLRINDDDDGEGRDTQVSWFATDLGDWNRPEALAEVAMVDDFAAGQDMVVKNTDTAITVDGVGDELVWSQAGVNLVANPYVGEPDDMFDSQAVFRMLWDETYLYFVCDVWDEELWDDSEGVNENDESFDMFFDPWVDGGDAPQEDDALLTLEWSPSGLCGISGAKGGFTELDTVGIIAKCTETLMGYTIEAAIPLDNLMLAGGDEFAFDLRVNDDDDGEGRDTQISWYATDLGDWNKPSALAVMEMSSEAKASKVENNTVLPEVFTLEQNYPNPFNPSTTINYSIAKPANVTLTVYNMLGREVSVLVNEAKTAGQYSVKFNASSLSNGIYFYSLQAGSQTMSKRMLLIK